MIKIYDLNLNMALSSVQIYIPQIDANELTNTMDKVKFASGKYNN